MIILILYRYAVRSFLPKLALLKLHYALVHSHLRYGLAIHGLTFPSYLNKLASLLNKAVKLVAGFVGFLV